MIIGITRGFDCYANDHDRCGKISGIRLAVKAMQLCSKQSAKGEHTRPCDAYPGSRAGPFSLQQQRRNLWRYSLYTLFLTDEPDN